MSDPSEWFAHDLLSTRTATTPERTALVDADAGRELTYREYMHWVEELVVSLESYASPYESRVGILLDSRPVYPALVFAAMRRSMVAVPLNRRLSTSQLRAQAERADLDVLVCGADTESLACDVAPCPVVSVDEPQADDVEALVSPASVRTFSSSVSFDRDALVLFTSGTTGDPKGVRLTLGNVVASAVSSAFRLGVSPDDRWLSPLPMCHMGGLAPALRSALYGSTLVVQSSFDADETARVIDEETVTGVSLVPTMLTRLLAAGWDPPAHLRFVLLGGAPASQDLIERCKQRGVPVHPTYGTTETASQIATARPSVAFADPETVGQPLLFTTVHVLDDGSVCDRGETGELVVDGPTVSPGYLDDDRTDEAFDEYGLHTGDVGYRDDDGRVYVVGRLDDVVVTGGENVHVDAVAETVRDHPAVSDVAVVGLDDPEWGQRVGALVVGDCSPADVRAHCEERLADFERPKTVAIADSLPRTPSGTVDRDAVRERLRRDGRDV